ncbi:hypothetical protein ACOMHN_053851 [Nucella lapillus]
MDLSKVKEQVSDDYFMNSGDKIRFFFEPGAIDKTGQLTVDKTRSVNKIGHALHCLNPVFKKVTFSDKVKKVVQTIGLDDPVVCQSMYIFKASDDSGFAEDVEFFLNEHDSDDCEECTTAQLDNDITEAEIWRALRKLKSGKASGPDVLSAWWACGSDASPGLVVSLHQSSVTPHQDSSSLYTSPQRLVGLWLALEDATVENGCLWFVPGSHKEGLCGSHRMVHKASPPQPGESSTEFVGTEVQHDQSRYIAGPVKKGTLVVIHGEVVHKSEPNHSERSREIYTFHVYDHAKAVYDDRNWLQPGIPHGPSQCRFWLQHRESVLTGRQMAQSTLDQTRPDQTRPDPPLSTSSDKMSTLMKLKEARKAVDKKAATTELHISTRRDTIVNVAKEESDKLLKALEKLHRSWDKDIREAIKQQEKRKQELTRRHKKVKDTLNHGSNKEIIKLAKDLMGRPCERLTPIALHRPVLHRFFNADSLERPLRDYLGRVKDMATDMETDVRVTKHFDWNPGENFEVFSLCHIDYDEPFVWVSFGKCGNGEYETAFKRFSERGGKIVDKNAIKSDGKLLSTKRFAKGRSIIPQAAQGVFHTYCKSPTASNFCLNNSLSGKATIFNVVANSGQFTPNIQFKIQVGPHRAFDVDDTEGYFVVVEEAVEHTYWRNVRLYRRPAERAVSTYRPPMLRYQPSDVCFYTLGEQKVLLVTDEFNDAIHVVTLQDNTLQFQRYLRVCPSLHHPTAITVDIHNRLWVGSWKGKVLVME